MSRYAIFFPQFHRVDVNDRAWGAGFTDWSLVATANAFDYWSRRAPAIGFYDLSIPAVIREQILAATNAGVDGFGIYHYWFEDGPELTPVEDYLRQASDLPNRFGYFLIWANESWTRRWAGRSTDVIKQIGTKPSRDEVRRHVQYLDPLFRSRSYRRLADRPMFAIYRPDAFSDLATTVNLYREEFARSGHNPAIGYFVKCAADAEYGSTFDFCYLFEPRLYFNFYGALSHRLVASVYKRLMQSISYSKVEALSKIAKAVFRGRSLSYSFAEFLRYFTSPDRLTLVESIDCPVQNVLTAGWNNAPRYRSHFTKLETPAADEFSTMLSYSMTSAAFSRDVPLLINAWNEWSEGAAIEECSYLGTTLLRWYLS